MPISDRLPLLIVAPLALAACHDRAADPQVLAKVEAAQSQAAADEGRINCALDGSKAMQRVCTVDRADTKQGLVLTVSHPDGGFHRLLVTTDGRGVVAADGAERAQVAIVDGNEIEVGIGDDAYRLPATVKAEAKAGK